MPFALKGCSLYKPAYIFFQANASEEPHNTKEFFNKILEKRQYIELVNISNKLTEKLKGYIPEIKELDILIETTPVTKEHEIYKLDGFKIWNVRKERFEAYPKEIDALNQYLVNNRQAYIFCNPKYYGDIKKLAQKELDEILGEMINEI